MAALCFAVAGALACLGWWALGLSARLLLRCIGTLPADPGAEELPRVSIVIAARDEAEHLEAALRSHLAHDHGDFELIVVNDRSSDDTGAIAERIAQEDARVRVVHVGELPEGWLGKNHALHRGTEIAEGEWILYTDADVRHEPAALRRALAHARSHELDHLILLPAMNRGGIVLEALYAVGAVLAAWSSGRAAAAGTDRPMAAMGAGPYNLVRAETFRRSKGWPWLRLEVLEDVGLGMIMKEAGGRFGAAWGADAATFPWYPSARAMFKGLEKNACVMASRFRLWRFAVGAILGGWVSLGPWWTALASWLAAPADPPLVRHAGSFGVLTVLGFVALCAPIVRRWRRPLWPLALWPMAAPLIWLMYLNSGLRCWWRGGIAWRGTLYPIRLLREHQRFLP